MSEEKTYSVLRTTVQFDDPDEYSSEPPAFVGAKSDTIDFGDALEDPAFRQYLADNYDLVDRNSFIENFQSVNALGPRVFQARMHGGDSGSLWVIRPKEHSGFQDADERTIVVVEISEDLLPEISEEMGKIGERIKKQREHAKKQTDKRRQDEEERLKKKLKGLAARQKKKEENDLKRAIDLIKKSGKKVVEN